MCIIKLCITLSREVREQEQLHSNAGRVCDVLMSCSRALLEKVADIYGFNKAMHYNVTYENMT